MHRHLAGCGRCRAALERLRATIADLALLGRHPVPTGVSVRDRVAERISRGDEDPS